MHPILLLVVQLCLAANASSISDGTQQRSSFVQIPNQCSEIGTSIAIIDSFPLNAYESFNLLRHLPRDIEFVLVLSSASTHSRDILLTACNAVDRGWDIALNFDFPDGSLDLTMFSNSLTSAVREIKQRCAYDIKYFATKKYSSLELSIAKTLLSVGLQAFAYEDATAQESGYHDLSWKAFDHARSTQGISLMGWPIYSHRSVQSFFETSRHRHVRFIGIDKCIRGDSERKTLLEKVPALVILDGEPYCKCLKHYISDLVDSKKITLGFAAGIHQLSTQKRFEASHAILRHGIKPIYTLNNLANVHPDMRVREVQLAASHMKRYSHGEHELKFVLSLTPCSARLCSLLSDQGLLCIHPVLNFNGHTAIKRVEYYLEHLRRGSVIMLSVKNIKSKRSCRAMQKILDFIAERVDSSKYLS